ncbi:hypothetical protein [Peribacillus sp. NPDC097225]|uniref:hypothetical protein n=1 Tax=Peribacillus sp. NPDC097225 TaxID=3364400 RepID=UPI0037FCCCE4
MDILGTLLVLASFIGLIVFFILGIISLVKKNGKAKIRFISMAGAFVLMIVGFIMLGSSDTGSTTTTSEPAKEEKVEKKETPEEKAERELKEKAAAEEKAKQKAEEKAKAEEEAKAKAEAEKKAKEKAEAEAKAKAEAKKKAKAEKKANAPTIPYAQLKKNPNKHKGEYVKYKGQIVQITEDNDYTNIRLAVTQSSYGYSYDDIVFIEYDGTTDFVEEDVITVYGEIYGDYSYTSQAGWEISIPGLLAEEIE